MFEQDDIDKLYLKTLPDLIDEIRSVENYIEPIDEDLEFVGPYILWRVEDRVLLVVTSVYTYIMRKTMNKEINEYDLFNMTNYKRWLNWLQEIKSDS